MNPSITKQYALVSMLFGKVLGLSTPLLYTNAYTPRALVATNIGTHCSLVTHTNKYGWTVT